ncbi:transketolase [Streptomyces sp. NRRL B-24484]|uniref:transketolase n=1 Tax=Streptomyces sp. NRRL B-24484 TaxID=1463833 RepID=UPI001F2ACBA3|nr:transketolase [Streptomyces sp. NRRL B-24484]
MRPLVPVPAASRSGPGHAAAEGAIPELFGGQAREERKESATTADRTLTAPVEPGTDLRQVAELAQQLRVDSVRASTAVVDVNRLGQCGPTELGWDTETYARRAEAFGCRAITVDGHDLEAVDRALATAADGRAPTVVVARTVKGRGVSAVADAEGWHGKPLPEDLAARAVDELGGVRQLTVRGPRPPDAPRRRSPGAGGAVELPRFERGEEVATRSAFGRTLVALGARPETVVLDAEVGNSTHTEDFAEAYPERFFQNFIAEQQMIATAVGMAVRGRHPYAATFAAFLTRTHDFVRMAAISQVTMTLCGAHCGVEIGADGPSQMGLEDLAMMRSVHGSTVLSPSDATSAAALTSAAADLDGISHLRATRGAYPVLYGPEEAFPVGGSKTLRSSAGDTVALAGTGVTVHECLAAADLLAEEGVAARVLDLYSVKPVDGEALAAAADETGRLVVVEDHHPEAQADPAADGTGERAALGARAAAAAHRGRPARGDTFATHRLPLSAAPDAYRMFQEKQDGAVKVVFTP